MKLNNTLAFLTIPLVFWAELSHASPITLIQVDLQVIGTPSGQQTQAGWDSQGLATGPAGGGSFPLVLTASGSAAGITATLGGDSNGWEARGGTALSRGQISGTSLNDLLEDFVATRNSNALVSLTGLTIGADYLFESWHNEPYTINQGFAAGGGTVTPSVIGGIATSSSIGAITNLRGSQTDSAFQLSSILFTATSAFATVTLSGINPNGFLPINGIRFSQTSAPVPEPSMLALFGIGIGVAGLLSPSRRKSVRL